MIAAAANLVLATLLAQAAPAEKKAAPVPASTPATPPAGKAEAAKPPTSAATGAGEPKPADGAKPKKPPKVNVYTFTGLDVEGKLKTPQLLYFLNRMKLEMDTSLPDRRSFMKELERSADSEGL